MSSHEGATPEGTSQFFKSRKKLFNNDKIRKFEEIRLSALAVGTYLGDYDDETDQQYEQAIEQAIKGGCNFFDTAINYRCQRSERALGRVLSKLISKKVIRRNQFVVSTKGGFLPFDSKPAASIPEYVKETWVDKGIVDEEDIVGQCHCLHPNFLQTQIDGSLANLQLNTIDLYYLHNPETQLPTIGPDLFFQRLEKAFALLEKNVQSGKIKYYGLATWKAFREPENVVESLSLEKVMEIATKVGGAQHHLRAIQLPYNMAMLEAISVHSQTHQDQKMPIIPIAPSYGLSVMISAPLLQSQLINLSSSILKKMPGDFTAAQKALQFVTSTPSVTAAMVGMKQKEHVEENLSLLKTANWDLPTLQKICNILLKR